MNAASLAVALAFTAWLLADLALLWALTGIAFADQVPGNRILGGLILLAIGAAFNAYALDNAGRYFNF